MRLHKSGPAEEVLDMDMPSYLPSYLRYRQNGFTYGNYAKGCLFTHVLHKGFFCGTETRHQPIITGPGKLGNVGKLHILAL